ncbi:hypothetical protein F383_33225 [Gossypium arboreum]|uniref:Uncharacterized protein n=1 Tax=Gossypium arboreum TaxID=29729 RepID=A0A0B0N5Z0_GOSAR|nr:hypothetical protein F383_33225 [Gossypium arboreum]
MLALICDFE